MHCEDCIDAVDFDDNDFLSSETHGTASFRTHFRRVLAPAGNELPFPPGLCASCPLLALVPLAETASATAMPVAPRWETLGCDDARAGRLAEAIGIAPVVARLLCQRGLDDPEVAARFLNPSLDHLHDPFGLA